MRTAARGALVVLAVAVLLWFGAGRLRAGGADPLPLTFAHADHGTVNCVACHHEFADATPRGPCLECHAGDPTVSHLIESQFHELCRGCHLERRAAARPAGPVRRCGACHTADTAP